MSISEARAMPADGGMVFLQLLF